MITIGIIDDKAIHAGILPDRQSRAGSAPYFDDFAVGPGFFR